MNKKKRQALITMLKKLEFVYIRISDLQTEMFYLEDFKKEQVLPRKTDIINGIRIDVKTLIDDVIDII